MNDALVVRLLSVLPRRTASRLQGRFARSPLSGFLVRWYAAHYGIDTDEMVGRPEDYRTLSELFVRPLRPGSRPVDPRPGAVVSPVDGVVHAAGELDGLRMPGREPGLDLEMGELLGEDAERYRDGSFAVLYLSPRDYHRVHHPREGAVVAWSYLPGSLWPVFPAASRRVRGLFARNERLVAWVEAEGLGRLAVVLVGAYGVGRIATTFCDLLTNDGGDGGTRELEPPVPVARGEELGRFQLGSTVILLVEAGLVSWTVRPGEELRVGRRIAALRSGL